MPRLALKTDSSFYRKIAMGAIGVRAVCSDLEPHGHQLVELERGSSESKIWKDVKRKRVRIPDLVCKRCGIRIECRAKTKAELSMSHSTSDAERAWDYGMVDKDWIAFPICKPSVDKTWSTGRIKENASYWHERNWIVWERIGKINYFTVEAFRSALPKASSTKGVTEGSETSITWDALFSTRKGRVEKALAEGLTVSRNTDNHNYTWRVKSDQSIQVSSGDLVEECQILASEMHVLTDSEIACPGSLPEGHIERLLSSRERTQRFTGIKLARLLGSVDYCDAVRDIIADREEDVYVRLEGASYLASTCGDPTKTLFEPFLSDPDQQNQLEAVIALGETATDESVFILGEILSDSDQQEFLRSAAAWSLGKIGTESAQRNLINAFRDVNRDLREEALENLVAIGSASLDVLLSGLRENDDDISAGCAEAIRQCDVMPISRLKELAYDLAEDRQGEISSKWTVWLLGHMPVESLVPAIARLQDTKPELHYAMSILWSFINSWISNNWELGPRPREYITED